MQCEASREPKAFPQALHPSPKAGSENVTVVCLCYPRCFPGIPAKKRNRQPSTMPAKKIRELSRPMRKKAWAQGSFLGLTPDVFPKDAKAKWPEKPNRLKNPDQSQPIRQQREVEAPGASGSCHEDLSSKDSFPCISGLRRKKTNTWAIVPAIPKSNPIRTGAIPQPNWMLKKAPKRTGAASSVPKPASCNEISVADLVFGAGF